MSPNPAPLRPDAESAEVVRLAEGLVQAFHMVLRTTRTHDWSNEITIQAIDNLSAAVSRVFETDGRADIRVIWDHIYVNGILIRQQRQNTRWIMGLINALTARGIGSVFFLDVVAVDDLRRFLAILNAHPEGKGRAFEKISAELASFDSAFGLEPVREEDTFACSESSAVDRREMCKRSFFQAVSAVEVMMKSVHLGNRLQIRFAKRIVQRMVVLMTDEESTLLGLTNLKSHDNYTYYHSVNVCVYAIAMGRRLGLDRRQLSELGTAALLHDLGKVRVPVEVLRKKGQLTDTERQRMQEHPIEGAKQLIRWGRYSPLILRAALGALEHHMSRDSAAGGYPVFRDAYGVHVAGRIIAIADCFDAMTTKRLYRHAAMRRDEALARMLAESGSKFDPVLLKLFINMIGAYPIGTVVRLRSGRLGLVKAVPKDPRLCHRPVIAIIPDASGKRAHRAGVEELDLARSGPDGEPVDEIVAALDAAAMGVDVGRYFL